jgi:hypothetical protein
MTAASIHPGNASSNQRIAVARTITSTGATSVFKHSVVGPELHVETELHPVP